MLRAPASARRGAGFSLIEVMIALAILALGIVGALAGIIGASTALRDGQRRQHKMALLDARGQQFLLMDKTNIDQIAFTAPSSPANQLAVGASPWTLDVINPGDLSTSPWFTIAGDGTITPVPVTGSPTGCGTQPKGVFCRESFLMRGTPAPLNGATIPAGARPYTLWTRISQRGDSVDDSSGRTGTAVWHTEVFLR